MSRLIHFTMQTCLTLFINYSYKYLQYLANMADVAEENHMLLPYLAKKKKLSIKYIPEIQKHIFLTTYSPMTSCPDCSVWEVHSTVKEG